MIFCQIFLKGPSCPIVNGGICSNEIFKFQMHWPEIYTDEEASLLNQGGGMLENVFKWENFD